MNLFLGNITDTKAFLEEEETQHCIKVLRQKAGDSIFVTNGKGLAVEGIITQFSKKEVEVEVKQVVELPSQTTGLHIAIAPTKNLDRFEFFIEKSIELGISEITPILSFHSERKYLNYEKLLKKAQSACKQSLQSNWTKLNELTSLEDFLENNTSENTYLAHCNSDFERTAISELNLKEKATILIGPEGDFSEQEIQNCMEKHSIKGISLGNNRLRTETAGIFVSSYYYNGWV